MSIAKIFQSDSDGISALPLWCIATTSPSEAEDTNRLIVAHSVRMAPFGLGDRITEVVVGKLMRTNCPAAHML